MVIVVHITSREGRADERGNQQQRAEVPPLEDIKAVARRLNRTKLRRTLDEFPDPFNYGDDREDS
jgi:hypothetical protein